MRLYDPLPVDTLVAPHMVGSAPFLEWLWWEFGRDDDLYRPLNRAYDFDKIEAHIVGAPRYAPATGDRLVTPMAYATVVCSTLMQQVLFNELIRGAVVMKATQRTLVQHNDWLGLAAMIRHWGHTGILPRTALWEELPGLIQYMQAEAVLLPVTAWQEAPDGWQRDGRVAGTTPVFAVDGDELWPTETALNIYLLRAGTNGHYLGGRLKKVISALPSNNAAVDGGRFEVCIQRDGLDTLFNLRLDFQYYVEPRYQAMLEVLW